MNTNTLLHDFSYFAPIQVRWADLDSLGHVNNAVFLTYFELARGGFIQQICPQWNWKKDMFLVASATIDFKKELRLEDRADVRQYVKLSKIGQKSFVLNYVLASPKDNEWIIYTTGTSTQVMIDIEKQHSIVIPNEIRTIFEQHCSDSSGNVDQ